MSAAVIPGPAPRIQHPGVELDILSDTGVADELRADELPPEMPVTPLDIESVPPPLLSLRTRSPEPADILDLLNPTDILESVEATSDRAGRHLQVGIGDDLDAPGDTGVPGDTGGPMPSPGPGGDTYGVDDDLPYGADDPDADPTLDPDDPYYEEPEEEVLVCDECCMRNPLSDDCLACTDGGVPCPEKGLPPEGFTPPKLKGVHFLASNPSKAVILTFNKPTNQGGDECGGFCPCSLLLDEETVKKLQVGPTRSPAACACHAAAPKLPLACGGNRAVKSSSLALPPNLALTPNLALPQT